MSMNIPALLLGIHSLIEQPRKYISFQAGRPFRNTLQNSLGKNVNSTIHQSRRIAARLLRKAADPATAIHVHRSISTCVRYAKDSHTSDCTIMRFDEMPSSHGSRFRETNLR